MATISGGSGNDSLDGTSGDDTITGNEGNDTIIAGGGADSIDGGTGNDSIFAGDGGANTVAGGDGHDTIEGGSGDESLSGGEGDDSIHGYDGADKIDGGAGSDTLYGDAGDDEISGGDGDDLIYAGDGSDRIDGGAGDDTLYGHGGADVFVVNADSGTNLIEDYNAADGDMIAIDYPGITSYADLQPYLSDDGNWGTLISFPDGSVTQVKWLNYGSQSTSNFTFDSGPVCFLRGTMIETAAGPRRVETLCPGDRIHTRDNGIQPLVHLGRSAFRFPPGPHKMKPIRLKESALGHGWPAADLLVSPQHRIALPQSDPQRIVAAKNLLRLSGVTDRPGCRLARYYHLLLPGHELIMANGAWAESLLVTDYTIRTATLPLRYRHLARVPVRRIGTGADLPALQVERAV